MSTDGEFAGGLNIAMKVPPYVWEATVAFYRDVVGLKVMEHAPPCPRAWASSRVWGSPGREICS
jgi:hypothetical protein